jgi:hypothetical protein|tara:strand:- start:649 stop:1206 length:558 start_codon:yes stop_codon:yes gene_type:complete
MNEFNFNVTNSIKKITIDHSKERIKYEFDRFGLNKEKRVQMIQLGTIGQLIFKEYLELKGIVYEFEFQAGNFDEKDFQIRQTIIEVKTSGYSDQDGYEQLNAIYNFDQMQHAELKNISLVVQVFINGYSKSEKAFNIEDCNKATIVGFSTIEELKSSKLRHLPFGKAYLKPLRELQNIEKLQSYV